jgi:ATP adenylyltransferase
MDHLFRPWRYAYVTSERIEGGCVLCALADSDPSNDASGFVLHRAPSHFVVLNIYPYNTGHLMIVPHRHVARLADLPAGSLAEMALLAARAEAVLTEVYHPDGINVGMNLGRSAGAGIADHLHLHVVPRWAADTNFVTVLGEARVLPEDLPETWRRLRGRFGEP